MLLGQKLLEEMLLGQKSLEHMLLGKNPQDKCFRTKGVRKNPVRTLVNSSGTISRKVIRTNVDRTKVI